MADLVIKRVFRAGLDHVYKYISKPEHILEWWGPEGLTVPVSDMNLGTYGPWMSEMHAPDGRVFKMSGKVTKVDPPNSVGFTFAWHDDLDQRGHESQVLIELEATGDMTQFRLTHTGFLDQESADSHAEGWTSSLGKLERIIPTAT
ncbi:MAG: SRPBCC family protein [Boseongicola sp.]